MCLKISVNIYYLSNIYWAVLSFAVVLWFVCCLFQSGINLVNRYNCWAMFKCCHPYNWILINLAAQKKTCTLIYNTHRWWVLAASLSRMRRRRTSSQPARSLQFNSFGTNQWLDVYCLRQGRSQQQVKTTNALSCCGSFQVFFLCLLCRTEIGGKIRPASAKSDYRAEVSWLRSAS